MEVFLVWHAMLQEWLFQIKECVKKYAEMEFALRQWNAMMVTQMIMMAAVVFVL